MLCTTALPDLNSRSKRPAFGGASEFAEQIWDQPPCAATTGFKWHVLHTRSRQEKAEAEMMVGAGALPFLPVHRRVVFYGHRRRVVDVPLFTSYLFLWGLLEHAYLA